MNSRKLKKRIEWFFGLFIPPKVIKANISYLAPDQILKGKKVIVTGGSRGIGYAIAKKFVSEGADVLITGRDEKLLQSVSEELSCSYLKLDVMKVSDFPQFMEKADAILQNANVLVNNAGISLHEGDIRHVTEESYDSQFDTNLKGAYFLSQEFLKRQKERGNCCILFVSSERGKYVDDIPYGLTKAAVNSLVQGLAFSLRKTGVRVNAIAPGITATQLTGKTEDNLYAPHYATGRYYLADEMAEVASFLISDASNCISGQILYCDNCNSVNSYKKR